MITIAFLLLTVAWLVVLVGRFQASNDIHTLRVANNELQSQVNDLDRENHQLRQKLYKDTVLPPGPNGIGDDTCPECGNQFDVQDDYICGPCRAKMGV